MTTLSGSVKVNLQANLTSALDLSSASSNLTKAFSKTLTDGAGADQCTKVWSDRRTVTATTQDNLDLAGVLTDAFGTAITFASVKVIMIMPAAANTADLYLGGDNAAQVSTLFAAADSQLLMKAGGICLVVAPGATGYAVTATTADILTIENTSGSSQVYDIILMGD